MSLGTSLSLKTPDNPSPFRRRGGRRVRSFRPAACGLAGGRCSRIRIRLRQSGLPRLNAAAYLSHAEVRQEGDRRRAWRAKRPDAERAGGYLRKVDGGESGLRMAVEPRPAGSDIGGTTWLAISITPTKPISFSDRARLRAWRQRPGSFMVASGFLGGGKEKPRSKAGLSG